MDSNETSIYTDQERPFCGLAILLLGCSGIVAHSWSLYVLSKVKEARNAFGFFCMSNAIASIGINIIFGLWLGPLSIFYIRGFPDYLDHKIGQMTIFFYYINVYTHVSKAVNRFVAISRPLEYKRLYTKNTTKKLLVIVWLLGALHATPHFFGDCYFYFDVSILLWVYEPTFCNNILGFYIDFIYGCSLIGAVFCVDIITLYNLKKRYAFFNTKETNDFVSSSESRKRKLDVGFFVQTCVAGISDMIMLTFGYAISPHMDIKWGNFLTTTMEWQLYHTADGIIMSIFATKWFHKRMPKQQQPPSVKTITIITKNEIPNRIVAFNNTQSLHSQK